MRGCPTLAGGINIFDGGSTFPGWKFQAADTVAAFGLHGVLIVGAPRPVRTLAARDQDLVEKLRTFRVSLFREGELMESGVGANVLGSPLLALRHLVEALADQPGLPMIEPGEVVTTGTLTAVFPIERGEIWHTDLNGLDLPGLTIRFA